MPCTTTAVDHYGLGVIEASVLEQSDNFENKDMNELSERDKRYKSETKNDKNRVNDVAMHMRVDCSLICRIFFLRLKN